MNTATAARTAGQVLRRTLTGPGAPARIGAALLVAGTLCSQHPSVAFARVSRKDFCGGLLPNWRFFAPNPAQHDYHFLYRTLNESGETSDWQPLEVIVGRKPHQVLWFPGRRPEKAVFDIGSDLLPSLDKGFEVLVHLPSYRMLVAYFRAEIRASGNQDVKGFQFTLARAAGYDESEEPEIIFVSPYTPMHPGARPATRRRAGRSVAPPQERQPAAA
ncbi:hypothetical protein [Streptomyces otsuchiensis]|uniref:hypothetical protein n=1 Tax=Streptomyces otsuchiensis TaxID=2681388 RepID=UPI0015827E75|nr:hypothetical protein [Streptomyces otsuchiensis]